MSWKIACLGLVLGCGIPAAGQQARPVPPGVRKADKLPKPADAVPPVYKPETTRGRNNTVQLEHEAEELATRAQRVRDEIKEVEAGKLPRDLNENLKTIEKLARQLRREVTR